MRPATLLFGLALLVMAAGYVAQVSWATPGWPFAVGTLSFVFIGAILAAIATPVVWIGLSREWGALSGGSLFPMITFGGMAVYLWHVQSGHGHGLSLAWPLTCSLLSLWSLAVYRFTRRVSVADVRSQPRLVRASFIAFALVLIASGTALTLQTPGIMPWSVKQQSSVLFGCIFLGAAASYAYAAAHPAWHQARGPLIGFVAYDVILIPPLLVHFGSVRSDDVPTLIIYLAILFYSGALGVRYLLLSRATRSWGIEGIHSPPL